jgi:DNA-binding MarR family transcriptional regulator
MAANLPAALRLQCDEVAVACACAALRKAARALTQEYDAAIRATGLRATQLTLLVAVVSAEGQPMTIVGRALGMDRTTLTRNLRPLERAGLVRVDASPEDGRRKVLRLTAKGTRTLVAALPRWTRIQTTVVARLGQRRWAALKRELALLTGETIGG